MRSSPPTGRTTIQEQPASSRRPENERKSSAVSLPDVHRQAPGPALRERSFEVALVGPDEGDPAPGGSDRAAAGEPAKLAGGRLEALGVHRPPVPSVGGPGGHADHLGGAPSDPELGVSRRKERPGDRRHVGTPGPGLAAEQPAQRVHGLLEDRDPLGGGRERDPERLVLRLRYRVARAEPEDGSTAAHLIQGGRLLGQDPCRSERRPRDQGPDVEAGMERGDGREDREGLQRGTPRRTGWEQVIGREHAVVSGRGRPRGGRRAAARTSAVNIGRLSPSFTPKRPRSPGAPRRSRRRRSRAGPARSARPAGRPVLRPPPDTPRGGDPSRRSPASPTPPPTTTTSGSSTFTSPAIPSPSRRPTVVKIAIGRRVTLPRRLRHQLAGRAKGIAAGETGDRGPGLLGDGSTARSRDRQSARHLLPAPPVPASAQQARRAPR